jgi:hypothetical protein
VTEDRYTPEQKLWFGAICLVGVVFAFVLAPFQGNDEWPHWVRAWTVAEGELRCGAVPKAALGAMAPLARAHGKLSWEHVRFALQDQPSAEWAPQHGYQSAACSYWPLAYVVPGLIAKWVALDRTGAPRKGGMIRGFWAARLASWATMCLSIFIVTMLLPWARNLFLAFFSIPEVIQETVALNNDLLLFMLTFVLLLAILRRPSWRAVWVIAAVIVCMTWTKPIFATLGALALPALVDLWPLTDGKTRRWKYPLALLALFVLPLTVRMTWSHFVKWDSAVWIPPWNVHPDEQVDFLLHHPLHVFTIFWAQARDTFSHELMRGSWRSILGALGSSSIELRPSAYAWCITSIAAALFADFTDGREPPRIVDATAGTRARRWAWVLAIGGILAMFPAVILAMYIIFTGVADDKVVGVQGRYYLIPLLLLTMLGLYVAKKRWPTVPTAVSRPSTMLAALGGVLASWSAIESVFEKYWTV